MGCQEGRANSLRVREKSRKPHWMADRPPESVTPPPIRAEVAGNLLEVIETGEGRLRAILDLIGGAQHSVKLLFYMFSPDGVGERVRDALVEAAQRGVEVKLLIDGFGSAAPGDFFSAL